MPWTSNGCGATAEFVELLNFGPGPVNIGCYVLTDGDFSVTIPPNTILQPGQFYLIAGQNIIPKPCANVNSTVTADLNWNTCGCTSGPIPTTGDGFFTDGGAANEQIVLLSPNKKVIDAVIRDLPVEPSAPITSSSIGGCAPLTFDLDTMAINYEVLGMSAGRGNSFARKLDGDCGWVKDPQQSGGSTNNTPGETSSGVTYNFSIIKSMDCDSTHGSVDILVNVSGSTDVFPMEYIIALDSDKDGIFELTDSYTQGVDSTPPSIQILGLPLGHYRVTVNSSKGCFLQTFEFRILECTGVLPLGLSNFSLHGTKNNIHIFEWTIAGVETLKEVILEKSTDARNYNTTITIPTMSLTGIKHFTQMTAAEEGWYRLKLVTINGEVSYSKAIEARVAIKRKASITPNPAKDQLVLSYESTKNTTAYYKIYSVNGAVVSEGKRNATEGVNTMQLDIEKLQRGVYYLSVVTEFLPQPISLRFVKH